MTDQPIKRPTQRRTQGFIGNLHFKKILFILCSQDTLAIGRAGKVLRLIRVMRILRVFKVGLTSKGLQKLSYCMQKCFAIFAKRVNSINKVLLSLTNLSSRKLVHCLIDWMIRSNQETKDTKPFCSHSFWVPMVSAGLYSNDKCVYGARRRGEWCMIGNIQQNFLCWCDDTWNQKWW